MNNPMQQQQEPQPRTAPQRVVLPDGEEVELQLVPGADIGKAVSAYQMLRNEQKATARVQEVAAFAQHIDTTPREPPRPASVSPGRLSGLEFSATRGMPEARQEMRFDRGIGTQEAPSRELLATNAAEAGVDVTSGAPAPLRTLAKTVGGGDTLRQLELINLRAEDDIKEAGIKLPPGVNAVFIEEYTGEPAYYRVERDGDNNPFLVPTLINAPGADLGDVIEWSPVALQAAAEALGSGVGAMLGAKGGNAGMTFGAAVGSGSMAAISNWTRQLVARSAGVPEELVSRIRDDEMLRDVLFAAGTDVAVGAGFALYRGLSNHWFRPLEQGTDVGELMRLYREGMGSVQTLEELLDKNLHITLGMATGDVQILALEAQAKNMARDKFARRFNQDDISNQLTVGSAIRRINQRAWPTASAEAPTEVGARTLDVIQGPGQRAAGRVERAEDALDAATRQLPGSDPKAWINTQTIRNQGVEQFREAEAVAWTAFRGPRGIDLDPATGVAGIWLRNAPNSPIRTYLRNIARENLDILSGTYRKARENLLESLNVNPSDIRKPLDDVFPSLSDNAVDFQQLHVLTSYLKQNAHRMEDAMPGWSRADVEGLIEAIERQIHTSPAVYGGFDGLQHMRQDPSYLARAKVDPERAAFIRDQWDQAKQATTQRHDFENLEALKMASEMRRVPGMPGDAVQPRTHEFVHQPDMVRSVFLRPNNSSALAELKHLEGFSPALKGELQRELLSEYRKAVLVDGKFSRIASDKFLENFDGHFRLLFGEQGAQAITNIQTLSDAVVRTTRRAEQVNHIARSVFGRQVDAADPPSEVARAMLTGNYTPTQVQAFKTRVERVDPMLWDDIQQQGLRWIESKLSTGPAGLKLNFRQLNTLIQGDTGRKLSAIYGQEYVDNLTVLRDVMSLMETSRIGQGWPVNVQTPLLQVSRSLLGPLSKKQRFITAMNRLNKSVGTHRFRELLSNPRYLDKWVEIQRHSPGSYAAAHAALGLPGEMFNAVDQDTRRQANVIRFFNEGGTVEQLARMHPSEFEQNDDGHDDEDAANAP